MSSVSVEELGFVEDVGSADSLGLLTSDASLSSGDVSASGGSVLSSVSDEVSGLVQKEMVSAAPLEVSGSDPSAASELSSGKVLGVTGDILGVITAKDYVPMSGDVSSVGSGLSLVSVPASGKPALVSGGISKSASAVVSSEVSGLMSLKVPSADVGLISCGSCLLSVVSEDASLRVSSAGAVLNDSGSSLLSGQVLAAGKSIDNVEGMKKSYLSVVQPKSALSKHDLSIMSEEGVHIVQVPDNILNNVKHLWDDLIIGKFPEDSPHIAKVHVIVNKIWAYGNKMNIIDVFVVNKSTIKFRIKYRVIRDRVLHRGMWNIADKPMMV